MAEKAIHNVVEQVDKKYQKLCNDVIHSILDDAKIICDRYHKVIEGFYLTSNMGYFAFNNSRMADNDEYPIYVINLIDDYEDWDMFELYGITEDKEFQELIELYNKYNDKFNIGQVNVQLIKDNNYKLERFL
jgi:hypothetical protein